MTTKLNTKNLPPEMLKQLGVTKRKSITFSKNKVRSHAIKCLASMSDLTQEQRRRVLEHAIKVNKI